MLCKGPMWSCMIPYKKFVERPKVHKGGSLRSDKQFTLTLYPTLTLMPTKPLYPIFRKLSEVEGKCQVKFGAELMRAQVCLTSLYRTLTLTLTLTKSIAQAKAKRELDILINTNKTKEVMTAKKVMKPVPSPLPCSLNP